MHRLLALALWSSVVAHYGPPPCADGDAQHSLIAGSMNGVGCFPACKKGGACPAVPEKGLKAVCYPNASGANFFCGLDCVDDTHCDTAHGATCQ
jgi:hypothetical protein